MLGAKVKEDYLVKKIIRIDPCLQKLKLEKWDLKKRFVEHYIILLSVTLVKSIHGEEQKEVNLESQKKRLRQMKMLMQVIQPQKLSLKTKFKTLQQAVLIH